ncbi:MAG: hypothetical protein ACUVX9_07495 [Anaerolineae bacterium]
MPEAELASLADAEDPLPGLTEAGAAQGEPGSPQAMLQARRRAKTRAFMATVSGLSFVAGLVFGWLVIGWWLWPVRWAESAPWDLRAPFRSRYVALVAAQHWQTGDARQARADLAGWDTQALTNLLALMEKDAASQDVRQQYVALRQALGLPRPNLSLWAYVLRRPAVALTAGLAALLLLAALALGVGPRLLARLRRHADDSDDMATALRLAREGGTLEPWMIALVEADREAKAEASMEEVDAAADAAPGAGQAQAGPAAASGPAAPVSPDQAKAAAAKPGADGKTTKPDKVKPPVQTFSVDAPSENTEGAQEDDEEQSLLAELFDGSDTLDPRLEALAPVTEPVTPAELLDLSASVATRLRQATGSVPNKGV